MKELLELIVKNLVGNEAIVEEVSDEERVVLTIKVPQEKIGLVIGKQGHIIKAIQDLIRIKATLLKKYVSIKVEPIV